jgi:hypothetical protein
VDANCTIEFQTIESKIDGPIYVYYQLDNFYQNHRRYVKSRENSQLAGQYLQVSELSACDPIIVVEDLWANQKFNMKVDPLTKKKTPLANSDPAIPCGLVAKSIFNDTFSLYKVEEGGKKKVDIIETGIAWSSDIIYKFKNVEMPSGSSQTW